VLALPFFSKTRAHSSFFLLISILNMFIELRHDTKTKITKSQYFSFFCNQVFSTHSKMNAAMV